MFVARHGKVTLDQVAAAAETLHRVSANVIGTVLTMAPRSGRRSGYAYQYSYNSRPDFVQGVPLPAEPPPPPARRRGARPPRGDRSRRFGATGPDWVPLLPEARNGRAPLRTGRPTASARTTAPPL